MSFIARLVPLVGLAVGCDCVKTIDTVTNVTPAADCLHFTADPGGNECRQPHLLGTNTCADAVTFKKGTGGSGAFEDVVVAPGAMFDYVIEVPVSGNPPTATIDALVGTTPTTVTLVQQRK